MREDFQKSGDEKSYLTEIKNITGNAVNDREILEFGKLNKPEFTKKYKICSRRRKILE